MGICSSPPPPPAPDYTGAAVAQGQANIDAAKVQGKLNNPNVVGPYGTQTVTYGGFNQTGWDAERQKFASDQADYYAQPEATRSGLPPAQPNRAKFMNDPNQANITQTFSPEQQALYEQQTGNQQELGKLEAQGIKSAQGILGTKVDYSGAPAMPGSSDAIRDQVYQAMMSRPNEDLAVKRDNLNSNLVAAGVRPGSQAFDAQANLLNRQETDAQMQALLAGGVEAQRNYGMDLQSRQQGLSEYAAKRQMPLNEITALGSMSQVSNPFAMPNYAQNANVAPAPMYQATNDVGQYGTDVYNAQMASQSGMASGLFGLGGSALMAAPGLLALSDRRLKSNIVRIGTHPLGIGLYEYDLLGQRQRGVMADEVLTVRPEAVVRHASGYLMVNYGRL